MILYLPVTGVGGGKIVHRVLGRKREIQVRSLRTSGKFLSRSYHDPIGRNVIPSGGQIAFLVADHVVLGLCEKSVRIGRRRPVFLCLHERKVQIEKKILTKMRNMLNTGSTIWKFSN